MAFLIALFLPLLSHADWLAICPSETNHSDLKQEYFNADGSRFWLSLSKEKPTACKSIVLPLRAGDLQWMELISAQLEKNLGDRVSLQGFMEKGKLKISEITPQHEKISNPQLLPHLVFRNLVPLFKFRSFGVEGRVSISRDDMGLRVNCQKGNKPAGVLLHVSNKKLPLFPSLDVELSYKSSGGFEVGISDQQRFDRGDPILLTSLLAKKEFSGRKLSVPVKRLKKESQLHWSLVCPKNEASIVLQSFSLQPTNKNNSLIKRSMWFWNPKDWVNKPEQILHRAKSNNAQVLFISVILDESKQKIVNQHSLEKFISLASLKQLSVWVVEGDPHVVLPLARSRFAKRAKIFQAYNDSHAKNEQLAGIQYDIEPYLIKGYSLAPETWAKAYVETIQQLSESVSLPLEVVIPFWWQFQTINNKAMLDYLAPYVQSINVMNYRTNVAMLHHFAQPILNWGQQNNIDVNIALEVGPISDETHWRYQKSDVGELWRLNIAEQAVLLLLKKAQVNSQGVAYQFQFNRIVPGDLATFKSQQDRFERLLPSLEKQWQHWSSFKGISIHGLDKLD